MLFYILLFILFLCVLHLLLNYNGRARMIKKIPGPQDDFLVGNGLQIIRSPVEFMKLGREYGKKFKGIYRIWVWPLGAVVVYNPEDIELIMSSMKYGEKSQVYSILRPWLQDGLLLSKGSKWQERRKILTPAFHFKILHQFCDIIEENTQRFLERLRETAGQPIDVVPVLSEYMLESICETAMGTKLNEDTSGAGKSYKQAIYDLGHVFYERFIHIYLYSDFIFNLTSLGRKQNKHLKTVKNFTEKVIAQRKAYVNQYGVNVFDDTDENDELYAYKKKKKVAMLDLLLSAEKEGLIDKAGIQEEVDTFMFEGHDTTATGLTFLFMLLANHKDVQDKIVTELKGIFGESNRWVCMEDLPKMKYIERCIKESLRLYPPVHFISRNLNDTTVLSNHTLPPNILCHIPIYELHHREDLFENPEEFDSDRFLPENCEKCHPYAYIPFSNHTLPPNTLCHIPIYELHHREDLFENPEEFDPDRFLPENCEKRHPYAYIPFSAGPRNCIGQKFALQEMKIAVAEVMREFELKPVTTPSDIQFVADLVLRNNGPVRVTFVKRQQ
ncbi:hypothetical protein PYW08_006881 [Mythimna loreyi]|uniref:Uncharacterized protein n=1 Tax=Mythimna loreyi TaxID=667449 RepID=A0ACC2R8U3_9NEOP|nr:hypothetical protein PYW08_006881 [Mythimna loreyi]